VERSYLHNKVNSERGLNKEGQSLMTGF